MISFNKFFETKYPDHAATIKMYYENSTVVGYIDVLIPLRIYNVSKDAWNAAIEQCRTECLSIGRNAEEASKSKDTYGYVAGYQDSSVDCDEAIKELYVK